MEYKTYDDNKELCLTPEHKIKDWADIIQKTALAGNTVLLYADTETTGLEYGSRGRGIYDPMMDRKKLHVDAVKFNIPIETLEKEARDVSGKIDRMIEISFVACFKNKSGETRPLLDNDGELIFFHEMISPYRDIDMPSSKVLAEMPIIPHIIHRTSFDFLKGKETHPFLNIKLPFEAPGTKKTLQTLFNFFDYEDDKAFDNIIMLFHNANEFDVPFIDAEIAKMGDEYSGQTLRDYVKVYDTLAIIKTLLPNPIQKLVSLNQSDLIYGGNPNIKDDKDEYITGHHKNLDNLIRFARFVPNFDLKRAEDYQNNKNSEFLKEFKNIMIKSHTKPTTELINAMDNNTFELDFLDSLDPAFTKDNKSIVDEYKKFISLVDDYNENISELKEQYPDVFSNLNNIKNRISNDRFFKENIDMINSIGRDSHGAKVDSMLFMYAMTIIENSMYEPNKITKELEVQQPKPISEDVFKKLNEHLENKKKAREVRVADISTDFNKIIKKHTVDEPVQQNKKQIKLEI